MPGWQSITTAPTDRPILTDDGLVIREDDYNRWAHCDREGFTFACADNGTYEANPVVWLETDPAFRDGTKWTKVKEPEA